MVGGETQDVEIGGRWDQLVGDLEAQALSWQEAERAGEIADRMRAELGRLRMVDRLRPAVGAVVALRCTGGLAIRGRVLRVVSDGVLVRDEHGRESLVALAHLLAVTGLGRSAEVPDSESVVESRIGLRQLARGIARDRSAVQVHISDGTVLGGTVDRLGADFLELAFHPVGESRRRSAVLSSAVVTLTAVVALRRDGPD